MKLKELLEVINPYEPIELVECGEQDGRQMYQKLLKFVQKPDSEKFKEFYDREVSFFNSAICTDPGLKGELITSITLKPISNDKRKNKHKTH